MLTITFYAHASFRLEADGLAVVTDPYTPGAHGSGFDRIEDRDFGIPDLVSRLDDAVDTLQQVMLASE